MSNQEWAIQRKPNGQSRMDNPEKTEWAIKNGRSFWGYVLRSIKMKF
jgi:hypothetical protein